MIQSKWHRLGEVFWGLMDELSARPFSRLILLATVLMTWRVTEWAFEFARMTANIPGSDIALRIAAVTAPFAALQGWALSAYTAGKRP